MAAADEIPFSRPPLAAPIAARVALAKRNYELNESRKKTIDEIEELIGSTSEKAANLVVNHPNYETGRLIAGLDALRQAGVFLQEALILPIVKKD